MSRSPSRFFTRAAMPVLLVALGAFSLSGCTAIALVDAAASTAVGVTRAAVGVTTTAVKGTAVVVGAAIPDRDDDRKSKK